MKLATKKLASLLKKASLAATEHIYFTGSDLFAYNGTSAVIQVCDTGFECLAPIKPLQKLIGSIFDEFVDISLEKNYLSIKSKGLKAKIPLPNDDNKNGLELENSMLVEATKHFNLDGQPSDLPTDFVEGVKLCLNIVKPIKRSAAAQFKSLFFKGDTVLLLSNLQATKFKFDIGFEHEFVISRQAAENIAAIEPFEYYADDKFVYMFNDEKDVLCLLKENLKYPEVDDIFESKNKSYVINSDEMLKILKTTLALKTADNNYVVTTLKNGKIQLVSTTTQGEIDQEYVGPEFLNAEGKFTLNTDYFLSGIQSCDSFSVKSDTVVVFSNDRLKYSVSCIIEKQNT